MLYIYNQRGCSPNHMFYLPVYLSVCLSVCVSKWLWWPAWTHWVRLPQLTLRHRVSAGGGAAPWCSSDPTHTHTHTHRQSVSQLVSESFNTNSLSNTIRQSVRKLVIQYKQSVNQSIGQTDSAVAVRCKCVICMSLYRCDCVSIYKCVCFCMPGGWRAVVVDTRAAMGQREQLRQTWHQCLHRPPQTDPTPSAGCRRCWWRALIRREEPILTTSRQPVITSITTNHMQTSHHTNQTSRQHKGELNGETGIRIRNQNNTNRQA